MSAERQTSMLCFKDVQAPPSPTRFSSQRLIGLWTWEQSCIPRRHFPQTSAQIVGNKGQHEAEVCGARDVPEGTVSCSCRHRGYPASGTQECARHLRFPTICAEVSGSCRDAKLKLAPPSGSGLHRHAAPPSRYC